MYALSTLCVVTKTTRRLRHLCLHCVCRYKDDKTSPSSLSTLGVSLQRRQDVSVIFVYSVCVVTKTTRRLRHLCLHWVCRYKDDKTSPSSLSTLGVSLQRRQDVPVIFVYIGCVVTKTTTRLRHLCLHWVCRYKDDKTSPVSTLGVSLQRRQDVFVYRHLCLHCYKDDNTCHLCYIGCVVTKTTRRPRHLCLHWVCRYKDDKTSPSSLSTLGVSLQRRQDVSVIFVYIGCVVTKTTTRPRHLCLHWVCRYKDDKTSPSSLSTLGVSLQRRQHVSVIFVYIGCVVTKTTTRLRHLCLHFVCRYKDDKTSPSSLSTLGVSLQRRQHVSVIFVYIGCVVTKTTTRLRHLCLHWVCRYKDDNTSPSSLSTLGVSLQRRQDVSVIFVYIGCVVTKTTTRLRHLCLHWVCRYKDDKTSPSSLSTLGVSLQRRQHVSVIFVYIGCVVTKTTRRLRHLCLHWVCRYKDDNTSPSSLSTLCVSLQRRQDVSVIFVYIGCVVTKTTTRLRHLCLHWVCRYKDDKTSPSSLSTLGVSLQRRQHVSVIFVYIGCVVTKTTRRLRHLCLHWVCRYKDDNTSPSSLSTLGVSLQRRQDVSVIFVYIGCVVTKTTTRLRHLCLHWVCRYKDDKTSPSSLSTLGVSLQRRQDVSVIFVYTGCVVTKTTRRLRHLCLHWVCRYKDDKTSPSSLSTLCVSLQRRQDVSVIFVYIGCVVTKTTTRLRHLCLHWVCRYKDDKTSPSSLSTLGVSLQRRQHVSVIFVYIGCVVTKTTRRLRHLCLHWVCRYKDDNTSPSSLSTLGVSLQRRQDVSVIFVYSVCVVTKTTRRLRHLCLHWVCRYKDDNTSPSSLSTLGVSLQRRQDVSVIFVYSVCVVTKTTRRPRHLCLHWVCRYKDDKTSPSSLSTLCVSLQRRQDVSVIFVYIGCVVTKTTTRLRHLCLHWVCRYKDDKTSPSSLSTLGVSLQRRQHVSVIFVYIGCVVTKTTRRLRHLCLHWVCRYKDDNTSPSSLSTLGVSLQRRQDVSVIFVYIGCVVTKTTTRLRHLCLHWVCRYKDDKTSPSSLSTLGVSLQRRQHVSVIFVYIGCVVTKTTRRLRHLCLHWVCRYKDDNTSPSSLSTLCVSLQRRQHVSVIFVYIGCVVTKTTRRLRHLCLLCVCRYKDDKTSPSSLSTLGVSLQRRQDVSVIFVYIGCVVTKTTTRLRHLCLHCVCRYKDDKTSPSSLSTLGVTTKMTRRPRHLCLHCECHYKDDKTSPSSLSTLCVSLQRRQDVSIIFVYIVCVITKTTRRLRHLCLHYVCHYKDDKTSPSSLSTLWVSLQGRQDVSIIFVYIVCVITKTTRRPRHLCLHCGCHYKDDTTSPSSLSTLCVSLQRRQDVPVIFVYIVVVITKTTRRLHHLCLHCVCHYKDDKTSPSSLSTLWVSLQRRHDVSVIFVYIVGVITKTTRRPRHLCLHWVCRYKDDTTSPSSLSTLCVSLQRRQDVPVIFVYIVVVITKTTRRLRHLCLHCGCHYKDDKTSPSSLSTLCVSLQRRQDVSVIFVYIVGVITRTTRRLHHLCLHCVCHYKDDKTSPSSLSTLWLSLQRRHDVSVIFVYIGCHYKDDKTSPSSLSTL